jgi:hypothetical protein
LVLQLSRLPCSAERVCRVRIQECCILPRLATGLVSSQKVGSYCSAVIVLQNRLQRMAASAAVTSQLETLLDMSKCNAKSKARRTAIPWCCQLVNLYMAHSGLTTVQPSSALVAIASFMTTEDHQGLIRRNSRIVELLFQKSPCPIDKECDKGLWKGHERWMIASFESGTHSAPIK